MSPKHIRKLKLKPTSKYISQANFTEEVLSLGGPEDQNTLVGNPNQTFKLMKKRRKHHHHHAKNNNNEHVAEVKQESEHSDDEEDMPKPAPDKELKLKME